MATSRGFGARPSSDARRSVHAFTLRTRSCSGRGTRAAQPWSRKWRFSSPRMLGTAKVENAIRRVGSNRSTALMRPMLATCTRSSSDSPARA